MVEIDAPLHLISAQRRDSTIDDLARKTKDRVRQPSLKDRSGARIDVLVRTDATAAIDGTAGVSVLLGTSRLSRLVLLIEAIGATARVVIVESPIGVIT